VKHPDRTRPDIQHLVIQVLMVLGLICGVAPSTWSSSYEVPLPVELKTDPDMCKWTPCTEVLPGADSFSPRMGRPAYVEAYRSINGQKQRVGYVFLSTDIVDIPAYSGKPVVTLIGMDNEGTIVGVKILKHSEPILLVGIPEERLTRFIKQFLGKKAWDKVEIGKARTSGGYIGIDAISGATVTVIAENQVVMRSAYNVARQAGIVKATPRPKAVFRAPGPALDWATLEEQGAVQRLTVSAAAVGETETDEPLIDIHFGYLNEPTLGRSILGEEAWRRLMERLGPDDHAIFLIASGRTTFKGSGFVRGGIFDRVQVTQDVDTFTFRDTDYINLYSVDAAGAPAYTESSIFIIRGNNFSAALPWSLVFLGNKLDQKTGQREFANFDQEYWLPDQYLLGGRPEVVRPDPAWLRVWKSQWEKIALFTLFLAATAAVYSQRDRLTRRARHRDKRLLNAFKYSAWAVSVAAVGFGLMAQPSVTQVLTWFHSLLFQWTWELFLSDPYIFIFWIFIVITVFLWGRGLFCGWLCPFGSLSELLYKIGRRIGLKRFQRTLPRALHNKLKWVKYGVFFGLLFTSLFSMALAEQLAEVEPFKTTFLVGLLNRSWPFTLFAGGLLGLSIFVERPFCKYLCPLGAALAVPSTFRWFGLKRKQECSRCEACAKGCGSLAIDAAGRIDQRECLLCLDCMVLYTDDHACPPLVQERKFRKKNAIPLTAIAADGYFQPVPGTAVMPARRIPALELPPEMDPRMPSAPANPACANPRNGLHALWLEIIEHLSPWQRSAFKWQRSLLALVLALTLAAVLAAIFNAGGHPDTGIAIGLWTGWCLFEVLERLHAKRYIKEGPWWQRHYRIANVMDMIAYVGFKNLIAGAVLFLIMQASGLLVLTGG
jgi:NosR/NirI family nitrous oxide reductase transcriptional regulator